MRQNFRHELAVFAVLGLVFGLTACGDSGTKSASKSQAEAIVAMCTEKLNQTATNCACLGEKAQADLTQREADFVLAMVDDDQTASDEMREELSMDEVTKAAEFLTTGPAACADGTP